MNISVNVDCTPQEARSFLGLPDVSPVHDRYIQAVLTTMDGGSASVEQMEDMVRRFSPMGDAGMRLFKQMMDIGLGQTQGKSAPKD